MKASSAVAVTTFELEEKDKPKGNKNIIVSGDGVAFFGRVDDAIGVDGMTKKIPCAKFSFSNPIPKCRKEKTTNKQKLCKKGMRLTVIGAPCCLHDSDEYAVFESRTQKVRWDKISSIEHKLELCDRKKFKILRIGFHENMLLYCIKTPRSRTWVSQEWIDEGMKIFAEISGEHKDLQPKSTKIPESSSTEIEPAHTTQPICGCADGCVPMEVEAGCLPQDCYDDCNRCAAENDEIKGKRQPCYTSPDIDTACGQY